MPSRMKRSSWPIPRSASPSRRGYIASDLNLWGKHGIKVKTVSITGIGAINSGDFGQLAFSRRLRRARSAAPARAGQKLIAIATTIDRRSPRLCCGRKIAEAGGYDAKSPLEKRGALLKGRTIAVDFHQFHDPRLCAPGRGPFGHQSGRHPGRADGARQHARGIPEQADRRYAMSLPWPQKAVQDGEALLIASGRTASRAT